MQERSCVLSFSTFFAKYFCPDFRFSKFLQVHFLLFCSQLFSEHLFDTYTGLFASFASYVPSFTTILVFQNVLSFSRSFVLAFLHSRVFSTFFANYFVPDFRFLGSSWKYTFIFLRTQELFFGHLYSMVCILV